MSNACAKRDASLPVAYRRAKLAHEDILPHALLAFAFMKRAPNTTPHIGAEPC
jgi:hypothetical protein